MQLVFYFYLYLKLHACNQRFDVTENLENFCELNKACTNTWHQGHGKRLKNQREKTEVNRPPWGDRPVLATN